MRAVVRNDIIMRRKRLLKEDHARYDDLRVSEIYKRIRAMLTPYNRANFSIVGFGPDGNKIPGHTTLRGWQSRTPKPTQQERDAAWQRHDEIEALVENGLFMITQLEEGIDDPEQKIPQALILALLKHFDVGSVRAALVELRLK
jgi:hypothetical protein